MEYRFYSNKFNREIVFTTDGNYGAILVTGVYRNGDAATPRKICKHGCMYGETIMSSNDRMFASVCKKWWNAYLRNMRNIGGSKKMIKTEEIILTEGLLVLNPQVYQDRIEVELMLTINYRNMSRNYDIVYRYNGDWHYFDHSDLGRLRVEDGWKPKAIRSALNEMGKIRRLSDEIKESKDWEYFQSWADASEIEIKKKENG